MLRDAGQQPAEHIVLFDHAEVEGPLRPQLSGVRGLGITTAPRHRSYVYAQSPAHDVGRQRAVGVERRDAGGDAVPGRPRSDQRVVSERLDDVAETLEHRPVPQPVAVVDQRGRLVLIEVGSQDLRSVADPAAEAWVRRGCR